MKISPTEDLPSPAANDAKYTARADYIKTGDLLKMGRRLAVSRKRNVIFAASSSVAVGIEKKRAKASDGNHFDTL